MVVGGVVSGAGEGDEEFRVKAVRSKWAHEVCVGHGPWAGGCWAVPGLYHAWGGQCFIEPQTGLGWNGP